MSRLINLYRKLMGFNCIDTGPRERAQQQVERMGNEAVELHELVKVGSGMRKGLESALDTLVKDLSDDN